MIKKQTGFSLIDLMITLAIIALLVGISAPNLVTGIPKYRVKSAARDLTSKLRRARSTAVKEHRDINIEFDTVNNRYRIDGQWFPAERNSNIQSLGTRYGSGVRFGFGKATDNVPGTGTADPVSFSGDGVKFNSRGLSNKLGYAYLTNNRGDAYAVGIRNLAGSIVLRNWGGASWQ